MTRAMRILVVTALVLGAVWLHFTLCEWFVSRTAGWPSTRVSGWGTEQFVNGANGTFLTHSGFGVFARFGVSKAEATVAGVALPAALLVTSALLVLKWRRDKIVGMGACPSCLHLRDPSVSTRCPECGWART